MKQDLRSERATRKNVARSLPRELGLALLVYIILMCLGSYVVSQYQGGPEFSYVVAFIATLAGALAFGFSRVSRLEKAKRSKTAGRSRQSRGPE